MKNKKKIIIAFAVSVVVLAGAVFGFFALKKNAQNKKLIGVYSMGDVGMAGGGYYDYDSVMSGYVTTDKEQNVYLTSSDKVKEVYVHEGDVVHAGDVLLEYDTTVQGLKLQSMRAEVEVARTDVLAAERQLAKLKEIVPIEDQPEPTTEEPTTETVTTPTDAKPDEEPEEPMEFDEPEDSYTREELEAAIKEKQQQINSLKIAYQIKQLDLEIEEKKNANGQVLCTFDGIVKTLEDEDTAILENKPFITVSGSDGYAVRSTIGELSLGKYHIGDQVSLTCYDNGMYYTGTISEISTTPVENGYYYSSKVQSYYEVIIIIEDAEDLRQGMYMEISFDGSDYMAEDSDDFYIPLAFVQKENGKYYIMKDVDGVLKKEFIKTGDILWGDMIAVKSGVSYDDYLALPTAKNAKEGIKTEKKSIDDLYGY